MSFWFNFLIRRDRLNIIYFLHTLLFWRNLLGLGKDFNGLMRFWVNFLIRRLLFWRNLLGLGKDFNGLMRFWVNFLIRSNRLNITYFLHTLLLRYFLYILISPRFVFFINLFLVMWWVLNIILLINWLVIWKRFLRILYNLILEGLLSMLDCSINRLLLWLWILFFW
jgi:hypothetical protein